MNWFSRKTASVRGRLILWNVITFAVVLVILGVGFRFLARNYLLSALDHEMGAQAKRMQEGRTVKRLMVTDSNITQDNVTMRILTPGTIAARMTAPPRKADSLRVELIQNVSALVGDNSGQFQYRSFNLEGKPLAASGESVSNHLFVFTDSGPVTVNPQAEQYVPWDAHALKQAAAGVEVFSIVESKSGPLRIMSLPLRDPGRLIGTAQIAASLAPVYRDISGLTRSLFLVLAPALLIAGLVGVFLTNKALLPVQALTRAANEIQPDQLEQRLPVSGADEFDELAATFNRALGRVELAFLERECMMDQLRRFTGDASHELRTPLTTIKANTGVALTDEAPTQEHIHALRQIDRAADRMTRLVDDLLLLARSDAGQLPLQRSSVAISGAIQEAVDLVLPSHVSAPSIHLQCEDSHLVVGDADQIIRLFRNLLENAVRYSNPGARVLAASVREGNNIAIRITDTGVGIAPEHLAHMGERFYRADSGRDRRQGGAGLGLAICRSIVLQHNGVITIESTPAIGTTVTILLRQKVRL